MKVKVFDINATGTLNSTTYLRGDGTWATIPAGVPTSRLISAGTGLVGGGDLSADRTLSLATTAVSPNTYTYATLTVDAYGRITSASSGAAPITTIAGLSDVAIASPLNAQVLTYDTATGKWKNANASGGSSGGTTIKQAGDNFGTKDRTGQGSGYTNASIWFGNQFTVVADGTIDSVVYSFEAAQTGMNAVPAIYTDSAGVPGVLLAKGSAVVDAVRGLNTLPLTTPLAVTAGQVLWIGWYGGNAAGVTPSYASGAVSRYFTGLAPGAVGSAAGSTTAWSQHVLSYGLGTSNEPTVFDTPKDSVLYGRQNGVWTPVISPLLIAGPSIPTISTSGYNGGIWFGNRVYIGEAMTINAVAYKFATAKTGINGTPAIYADSSATAAGALLATGPGVIDAIVGENVLPLSTPLVVAAGTWLWIGCYQNNVGSISAVTVSRTTSSFYFIAGPPAAATAPALTNWGTPLAIYGIATKNFTPYAIPFGFTSSPVVSETLLIHTFVDNVVLPDEFENTSWIIGVNPTGSVALDVQKYTRSTATWASVGTITIATTGVVTLTTAAQSVSFVPGDGLRVIAPATADATLANVAITFKGSRS